MPSTPIHLASSSPRRKAILERLGVTFSAGGVGVDERRLDGERAEDMVLRLAVAKANAAAVPAGHVVIGADTAVVVKDQVFGKPRDEAHALAMLEALSSRTHRVVTGVAVCSLTGTSSILSTTDVRFREIGRDEALRYWQSGEPVGKAGAYAIQGRGGVFVERLAGSYSGVVGLPVFETSCLLREAGVDVL